MRVYGIDSYFWLLKQQGLGIFALYLFGSTLRHERSVCIYSDVFVLFFILILLSFRFQGLLQSFAIS